MGQISTVYDEIRSQISGVLTTHTELNNPYFIEDDADVNFDNGWCVGLGAADNTNRYVCNKLTVSRDFTFTLTKRVFAVDRDITKRITAEKALFEYQMDVLKVLDIYTSDVVVKMRYTSDNGLEFLDGDRFGILMLQTTINVEYFENL